MKLYHYAPETGALVGSSQAEPDPLELENARRAAFDAVIQPARETYAAGLAASEDIDQLNEAWRADLEAARATADAVEPTVWLIPAFATAEAPPEAEPGELAVFRGGAWTLEPVPAEAQPEPLSEEAVRALALQALRFERDRRMAARRWLIERHRDEVDLGRATTLTPEQYAAELTYQQALRDLPATVNDPAAPAWPAEPV